MVATSPSAGEANRRCNGRKTTRSSSTPNAGAKTNNTNGAATHTGSDHSSASCQNRYAAIIATAPCATLNTPVAR